MIRKAMFVNVLKKSRLKSKISADALSYLDGAISKNLSEIIAKARFQAELSGRKIIRKEDIEDALKEQEKENIFFG